MRAVITGASRGIGKAIAIKFAKEGYDLALCSRVESNLLALKEKLNKQYPNVEIIAHVTDVSETDIIGITGSFYRPSSEWISTYSDNFMWNNFMVHGNFFDPINIEEGDFNLFVSSGLFPLQPGQTEPISLAVILANGPIQDPNGELRKEAILEKRIRAQETYNNDYQFANAPLTPKLTAIPGDNRVTLYWDDEAENSFDNFIASIGGNPNDFEGYRIYR